MGSADAPLLSLRHAAKAFGAVQAVVDGSLDLYGGGAHALLGIISPTSVGIVSVAQVIDSSKYRGKIAVTGLGTPDSMKKFVHDGTVASFVLWNPANLGYLAAYAAVELASGKITNAAGQSLTAGKLGKFTVGSDSTILLGDPRGAGLGRAVRGIVLPGLRWSPSRTGLVRRTVRNFRLPREFPSATASWR